MKRKKKVYKLKKDIVGLDIKPEFPKKPNIIIRNNFDKPAIKLSNELDRDSRLDVTTIRDMHD